MAAPRSCQNSPADGISHMTELTTNRLLSVASAILASPRLLTSVANLLLLLLTRESTLSKVCWVAGSLLLRHASELSRFRSGASAALCQSRVEKLFSHADWSLNCKQRVARIWNCKALSELPAAIQLSVDQDPSCHRRYDIPPRIAQLIQFSLHLNAT